MSAHKPRWEDLPLDQEHIDMLKSSGISPEVAKARGYATVENPAALLALGFAAKQAPKSRLPGLLLPMYRPGVQATKPVPVGHQLRPRLPRKIKGRPLKYETPTGRRNVLDMNPLVSRRRPTRA